MTTTTTAQITDAGVAAAIAARGTGLDLNITHVALGASAYTPTASQSGLVDRRETAPVLVGAKQGNQCTMTVTFLAASYTGAAYSVGEVGFYAGDPNAGGTLVAVISAPGRASPARGGSVVTNYTPTFVLNLTGVPSGSIGVTFDPTAAAALIALAAHVAAANPHPQYDLVGTPIGAVQHFYATTAPTGWLALDGSLVSRTTYATLWAYVQAQSLTVAETAWSANTGLFSVGDGSTNFRLPDLRAEFVRGLDGGRGVDAGRTLGSTQASANLAHTHNVQADDGGFNTNSSNVVSGTDRGEVYLAQTSSSGGSEARPRNVALLACIKSN